MPRMPPLLALLAAYDVHCAVVEHAPILGSLIVPERQAAAYVARRWPDDDPELRAEVLAAWRHFLSLTASHGRQMSPDLARAFFERFAPEGEARPVPPLSYNRGYEAPAPLPPETAMPETAAPKIDQKALGKARKAHEAARAKHHRMAAEGKAPTAAPAPAANGQAAADQGHDDEEGD